MKSLNLKKEVKTRLQDAEMVKLVGAGTESGLLRSNAFKWIDDKVHIDVNDEQTENSCCQKSCK